MLSMRSHNTWKQMLVVLALLLMAGATGAAARMKVKIPGDGAGLSKPVDALTFRRELTARLGRLALKDLRKLYTDRGGKCGDDNDFADAQRQRKRCASKKFLVKAVAKQMAAARGAVLRGHRGGDDANANKADAATFAAAQRELGKVSLGDFGAMLRNAAKDDDERASLTADVVRQMYVRLQAGLKDPSNTKKRAAADLEAADGAGWWGGGASGGGGSKGDGGAASSSSKGVPLPSQFLARWLGLDREGGASWAVVAVLSVLFVLQVRVVRARVRDHGWKALFVPTTVLRQWRKKKEVGASAAMPKDGDIDAFSP